MVRWWLGPAWVSVVLASTASGQDPAERESPAATLRGGEALHWRRPIRAWPLLEWDRFDRTVLGPDPDEPDLRTRTDFDLLWPVFGFRREVSDPWSEPERAVESGHAYLLPLWLQTWSPHVRTASLLPLVTLWDRAGIGGITIWPALFDLDWRDGGFELDFPWPLAGVRRRGHAWTSHVFPVWWAGADDDDLHVALLPLFYYGQHDWPARRGATIRDTTLVSPIAVRVAHDGAYPWEYTALTPLLHRARTGTAGLDALLPLVWHSWNARGWAWATPVFAAARHDRATWWSATPLVHHWDDAARGASLDLVLPIWVRGRGPHRSGGAVGPVWWGGRTDRPGSAWGIFPIWWWVDYPDVGAWALPPLAGHVRTEAGAFGWAGPAWWCRDADDSTRGWGVFPLLWSEDGPEYRLHALWPLLGWASHGPAEAPHRFEASVGWPLLQWIADDRDGRRQAWFPWPLVTAGRTDDGTFLTIAPAIWASTNRSGFHLELAPAFLGPWGSELFGNSAFFLGVAWPIGLSIAVDRTSTWWWAGAGAVSWYSEQDGDWRFRLGYEVVSMGSQDDTFELRVLYRLFHYRHGPGEFRLELNPLFRYESTRDGWYFSMLLGMYAAWSRGDGVRQRLFWGLEF